MRIDPAGRRLLRARDKMDRSYAEPLDVPALARVAHTSEAHIYVLDQDEALEFYVGKLGLELNTDADLGAFRWVTVNAPGNPESQLVLATPEMGHDEETAAAIRELVAKGAGNGVIFSTDDCRGTYEKLLAGGVEFTQEPTEHFYGIDCGLRDPFGNPLRFTQPKEGPIEIPAPEEFASAD